MRIAKHMLLNCVIEAYKHIMEAFETTLTGSDGDIAGFVTQLSKEAYQFTSFDDALHLTIAKDEHGKWTRLSGSEPYFSGWVDELIEKVTIQTKMIKPASKAKTPVRATPKETVKAVPVKTAAVKKVMPAKKATTTAPATKKQAVAPSVKAKAKPNTDKKTTVAASANKKAKVSSAVAKGK